jgi:hypothetical protein
MGKLRRPKALYYLKLTERKEVLRWLKTLKFIDRYAANIKCVVNVGTNKLSGLKSHDYHIFIERLMPVMFRGYFKANLWKMFAELSYFYRHICSKQVSKAMMQRLEKHNVVLVCKMETVFTPGWFNGMQHFLMYLPCEARVGGHVQFRWMYSQERELKKLRYMFHNKAMVEGCITELFACKDITNFSSMYFSRASNVNASIMRYHVVREVLLSELTIFQWNGSRVGSTSAHCVTDKEWNYSMLYLYTNIVEVEPYYEKFDKTYWTSCVQPTLKQLDHMRELGLKGGPSFLKWF